MVPCRDAAGIVLSRSANPMGMLLCSAGCAVLQHTRWHGISHGGTASCVVTGTQGSNRRHAVPRAMAQGRSSYRALGPALVCTAALEFSLGSPSKIPPGSAHAVSHSQSTPWWRSVPLSTGPGPWLRPGAVHPAGRIRAGGVTCASPRAGREALCLQAPHPPLYPHTWEMCRGSALEVPGDSRQAGSRIADTS